nr:replication protein A 70 kDa DNA-binding subunit B-like [Ipomoea batatas]
MIRTYTVTEGRNKSAIKSQECLFHDIEDLLAGKVEEKQLIVVEFYSLKDKVIAGFPTQLVDLLIEDSKGNRIKCTLWNEHVPVVMPFFNNHVDDPLIVLLQLCRAKVVDSKFTSLAS